MCSGAHSWLAPRRSTRVGMHSAPWLAEPADSATPPPQGGRRLRLLLKRPVFCLRGSPVCPDTSTAGERLMLPGKTLGALMVQKWRTLSVGASWALVAMDTETKAPGG